MTEQRFVTMVKEDQPLITDFPPDDELAVSYDKLSLKGEGGRWIKRCDDLLKRNGLVVIRNVINPKLLKKVVKELQYYEKLEEGLGQTFSLIDHPILPWLSCIDKVVENSNITRLIKCLLKLNSRKVRRSRGLLTTKYRWLRFVRPNLFTGLHRDRYYLKDYFNKQSGSHERLYTTWIPFLDVIPEYDSNIKQWKSMGSLAWIPGSHLSKESLKTLRKRVNKSDENEINGKLSDTGTTSGWVCEDASYFKLKPQERWVSTYFNRGDICLFNIDLLHMTFPNTDKNRTNRISCDVRWRLGRVKKVEYRRNIFKFWKLLKQ